MPWAALRGRGLGDVGQEEECKSDVWLSEVAACLEGKVPSVLAWALASPFTASHPFFQ